MAIRIHGVVHGASALLLLTLLVAACGGAASSAPADAPAATAAAATTAAPAAQGQSQQGGAGSVSDGLGHPVNVCALLPAATVASITAEPITKAVENDTLSYKIYDCDYSSTDGTSGLSVSVLALDAAAGYDGSMQASQQGNAVVQIGGLGDKAFSSILGVFALFGNVSITVSNLRSVDAAETLIRTLQPKL